jgi:hypothetical protein
LDVEPELSFPAHNGWQRVASGADQILIRINTLAAFCCQQYVGM